MLGALKPQNFAFSRHMLAFFPSARGQGDSLPPERNPSFDEEQYHNPGQTNAKDKIKIFDTGLRNISFYFMLPMNLWHWATLFCITSCSRK